MPLRGRLEVVNVPAGVPSGIHVLLHKCAKTQEKPKSRRKAQRKYGEFHLDQRVAALHSGVSWFFLDLSVQVGNAYFEHG